VYSRRKVILLTRRKGLLLPEGKGDTRGGESQLPEGGVKKGCLMVLGGPVLSVLKLFVCAFGGKRRKSETAVESKTRNGEGERVLPMSKGVKGCM